MADGKMGGGYGPIDSPTADQNKDGTYDGKSTGGVK
jgi:hypothetical protein